MKRCIFALIEEIAKNFKINKKFFEFCPILAEYQCKNAPMSFKIHSPPGEINQFHRNNLSSLFLKVSDFVSINSYKTNNFKDLPDEVSG